MKSDVNSIRRLKLIPTKKEGNHNTAVSTSEKKNVAKSQAREQVKQIVDGNECLYNTPTRIPKSILHKDGAARLSKNVRFSDYSLEEEFHPISYDSFHPRNKDAAMRNSTNGLYESDNPIDWDEAASRLNKAIDLANNTKLQSKVNDNEGLVTIKSVKNRTKESSIRKSAKLLREELEYLSLNAWDHYDANLITVEPSGEGEAEGDIPIINIKSGPLIGGRYKRLYSYFEIPLKHCEDTEDAHFFEAILGGLNELESVHSVGEITEMLLKGMREVMSTDHVNTWQREIFKQLNSGDGSIIEDLNERINEELNFARTKAIVSSLSRLLMHYKRQVETRKEISLEDAQRIQYHVLDEVLNASATDGIIPDAFRNILMSFCRSAGNVRVSGVRSPKKRFLEWQKEISRSFEKLLTGTSAEKWKMSPDVDAINESIWGIIKFSNDIDVQEDGVVRLLVEVATNIAFVDVDERRLEKKCSSIFKLLLDDHEKLSRKIDELTGALVNGFPAKNISDEIYKNEIGNDSQETECLDFINKKLSSIHRDLVIGGAWLVRKSCSSLRR